MSSVDNYSSTINIESLSTGSPESLDGGQTTDANNIDSTAGPGNTAILSPQSDSQNALQDQAPNPTIPAGFQFIPLTPATSHTEVVIEMNRLGRLIGFNVNLVPILAPEEKLLNPKACFTRIPPEIRQEIYGYLLHNPILAESLSVSRDNGYGSSAQYDLYPKILEVNRMISKEGTTYLYGRNTFYMACLPSRAQSPYFAKFHLTPLTRYATETDSGYPSITKSTSIEKVQKWITVVITRDTNENISQSPPWSFFDFVRAICQSPPKSLQIALIQMSVEKGLTDADYLPIEVVLKPLWLLRNVEFFQLRDATPFEVPDEIDQDEDALLYPSQLEDADPIMQVMIMQQVTGNGPLECAFKMYEPLLRYAQAFESNINFKKEMGLAQDAQLYAEWLGNSYEFYHNNPLKNPFKGTHVHPVEEALMRAKLESDQENLVAFKTERASILHYLESQFQRISNAASNVKNFVKKEKIYGGLFDAEIVDEEQLEKLDSALALIYDYANSFMRDVPTAIQSEISQHQKLFDSFYSGLSIENLMWQLSEAFDTSNLTRFVDLFREAMDDLDEYLLEILKQRDELFKHDNSSLNQVVVTMYPQISLARERIDWSVNETPDSETQ